MSSRRSRSGGEVDVEDVEPVVEVVPELAQRHRLPERAVGGGDDPDVHLDRLDAAHPEEGAALQHPEQLDLGGRRDLADLVEEDGPGVGQLEPAEPPLGGAGEGALLVAEQLRLSSSVSGSAAQLTAMNGLPAPGREVVERLGDQLLAGARSRPGSAPCSRPAPSARS